MALTEAFLVRKRETGDPVYMGYAKDAMIAARSLAPQDAQVRTADIMFLLDAHRFADAAHEARQVAAEDPRDATGHLLLSDALLELGDYEGAVAALEHAMERAPDLRSYSRAAYLRWLHNDVEGALEMAEDAIKAGSRTPEPVAWCHADLGVMLWHKGDLAGAERAAERALALVPGYAPALSLQARVRAAQGRVDEAIMLLRDVVARMPTAEELLQLGELLAGQGQTEQAAEALARAEKLAEHDPLPLALYYARHAIQAERALALAGKAAAERGTIYTHDALALALLRSGRIADAAGAMARALTLETPDARLYLHRGLIELAQGQRDAARASLDRANALSPHADPRLAGELAQKLASEAP